MKIAYHLALHKNLDQALELLDAIWTPEDRFLVHVDKKTGPHYVMRFMDHVQRSGKALNISLQERLSINWGCPSLMTMYYRGICTLARMPWDWDYYINLSGQDFPLKNTRQLKDFLTSSPRKNFIQVLSRSEWPLLDKRLGRYFVTMSGKQRNTRIYRTTPPDIEFYGGSVYCALTREFCNFMAASPLARRVIRFLQFSKMPDEIFLQTLLMASPFKKDIVSNNLRFVLWPEKGDGHPILLTSEHLDILKQSDKWFAKKFDWDIDRGVTAELKRMIENAPIAV